MNISLMDIIENLLGTARKYIGSFPLKGYVAKASAAMPLSVPRSEYGLSALRLSA